MAAVLGTLLRKSPVHVSVGGKSLLQNAGSLYFANPPNRGAKKWFPDHDFTKQFDGPVMYPDDMTGQWKMPPWNHKVAPVEKKVRNLSLNFGPQHPAAHGVLRLVLELDGEHCLPKLPES
ncbi:NADH dehydrogenase [ubiquinone] iron-sulfur protein 2 [Blattella germanica]|nr:NADH dehydrogenase [ubiquinone] iron-sulfur protein 2 [Blattella germanica]